MNVTINDLMVEQVMTATPHQTVEHVRQVMRDNSVSCMPVVDSDEQPSRNRDVDRSPAGSSRRETDQPDHRR